MSEASNPAADPGTGGGITEEQLQQYLQQLRSAPAEQVLTEVLGTLLNAAQAKLGRNDARLLIDVTAVAVEHARPYLSTELTGQLDQAFSQLRMEQVRAEQAVAEQGSTEQDDLPQPPAPPAGAAGGQQPPAAPSRPQEPPRPKDSPASRLWVPGR